MHLSKTFYFFKEALKQGRHQQFGVPLYRKSTALFRAVFVKGSYNEITLGLYEVR